jgi:hypothetical protein
LLPARVAGNTFQTPVTVVPLPAPMAHFAEPLTSVTVLPCHAESDIVVAGHVLTAEGRYRIIVIFR